VPHFYLSVNIDMDALMDFRTKLAPESKIKISINDFIIKACALALRDIPDVNAQWHTEVIRKFQKADISVAVNTE